MLSPGKDSSTSAILQYLDEVEIKSYSIKQFSKEYSKEINDFFDSNNSLRKEDTPKYMLYGCSVLMWKDVSEFKPNGIIFYDIDETLSDHKESIRMGKLQILNKDSLMKELKLARENNFLVGLLTSRTYHASEFSSHVISTYNIITTIGKEFFDFIIYTNNVCGKYLPMLTFQDEFALPPEKLCLIDDVPMHLDLCRACDFVGVHSLSEMRHQQILDFLSPVPKKEEEKESLLAELPVSDQPVILAPLKA